MSEHPTTVRNRAIWLLATSCLGLVALGGCGRSEDAVRPSTTTEPAVPTTTLSPDDRYDQALADQLDGISPAFIDGSRTAGHALCTNLATLAAGTVGDTPPSADGGLGDLTQAMIVGAMFQGYSQPAVAAVVLRATADHLCPEHAQAIEQVLTERGQ